VIRIDRGAEVAPGIWKYSVSGYPQICGRSRQPLLDACRQLKTLHGLTAESAGLFRDGFEVADISCLVGAGARLTICEPDRGRIRFEKYKPFVLVRQFEAEMI
jgi:hypothetical protein